MIVTVAVLLVAPSLSSTVYVNVSVPWKFASGVYVTVPSPLSTTVPLAGCTMANGVSTIVAIHIRVVIRQVH